MNETIVKSTITVDCMRIEPFEMATEFHEAFRNMRWRLENVFHKEEGQFGETVFYAKLVSVEPVS